MPDKYSPPPVDFQIGSAVTDAAGDDTVTFTQPFGAAPKVFLQGIDAAAKGIVLDVVAKSTTQIVVKARKVTGITSGAGSNHTHSFTGDALAGHSHTFTGSLGTTGTPSTTATPVDNVYYVANTGGPSATVSVASSGHTHTGSAAGAGLHNHRWFAYQGCGDYAEAPKRTEFRTYDSVGNYIGADRLFIQTEACYTRNYFTTNIGNHTHTVSVGAPVGTTSVATSTHTHAMGAITVDRVTVASNTHTHTYTPSGTINSVSAGTPSGTVGGEAAHTHSVNSPVLSISYDWFAILS